MNAILLEACQRAIVDKLADAHLEEIRVVPRPRLSKLPTTCVRSALRGLPEVIVH